MPIYEYECKHCSGRFERRQMVTEQSVEVCTSCGGPVRRVYHPVGIVFKGSGFYSTDNRRDKIAPAVGSGAKRRSRAPTCARSASSSTGSPVAHRSR